MRSPGLTPARPHTQLLSASLSACMKNKHMTKVVKEGSRTLLMAIDPQHAKAMQDATEMRRKARAVLPATTPSARPDEVLATNVAGERVLVLSHTVLSPRACDGTTLAWDYEAALEAISQSGDHSETTSHAWPSLPIRTSSMIEWRQV